MSNEQTQELNIVPPLVILAVGAGFLFWTYGYSPEARLFPTNVGWAWVVLAGLDVLSCTDTAIGRHIHDFFTGDTVGGDDDEVQPAGKALVGMLWLIAFVTAVGFFGFFPVMLVYVFSFMVFQGGLPMRQSIIMAVVSTAVSWGVFEKLMNYEMYRGVFFSEL